MNNTEKKLLKVLEKLADKVLHEEDKDLPDEVELLYKAATAIGAFLGKKSAE